MIWGVNGGIGQALTVKCAAKGWQVAAIVQNGEEVPSTSLTIEADVTDAQAVETAVLSAAYEIESVNYGFTPPATSSPPKSLQCSRKTGGKS